MFLEIAEALLKSVQKNQETDATRMLDQLVTASLHEALLELNSDDAKNVFWVNIYNAFFQLKARESETELLQNRSAFFVKKKIPLFGYQFSFDQIEHRFLRKSKWKYGFGYITRPFSRSLIRNLSVNKPDYRVHFVLNCGAKGCPIIRPLNLNNIAKILDLNTCDYLKQEVWLDEENCRIKLNQLFMFFLGDFGGRKGLKKILLDAKIIKKDQMSFRLKFTTFDQTPKLNHFASD